MCIRDSQKEENRICNSSICKINPIVTLLLFLFFSAQQKFAILKYKDSFKKETRHKKSTYNNMVSAFSQIVVPLGLEPRTPWLWVRCSNQLSYRTVSRSHLSSLQKLSGKAMQYYDIFPKWPNYFPAFYFIFFHIEYYECEDCAVSEKELNTILSINQRERGKQKLIRHQKTYR